MRRNSIVNTTFVQRWLRRVVAVAVVVSCVATALPVHADTPVTFRGQVVTRGLVVDEQGNPILAEYDATGEFVTVLPDEIQGKVREQGTENVRLMSGKAYRLILSSFDAYRDQHAADVARGARVMNAQEYQQAPNLGLVDVLQPDGQTVATPLPKPRDLYPETRSVLVRSVAHLSSVTLSADDILLFEAPIDLTDGVRDNSISNDHTSVLIGAYGEVLHKSTNRIGYRTAFYVDEDDPTEPEDEEDFSYDRDNIALGPIENAQVDTVFGLHTSTTDTDGKFELLTFMPPCMFLDDIPVTVAVPYRRFNPQSKTSLGYRYVGGNLPLFCAPTFLVPVFGVPTFLLGYTDVAMSLGTHAVPVDLIGVSGQGVFRNSGDTTIISSATSATEYEDFKPAYELVAPRLDLDDNGHTDWVGAPVGTEGHENEIYESDDRSGQVMVVLGGNPVCFIDGRPYLDCELDETGEPRDNPMPHLYRTADFAPDFESRGLLKSISREDIKDTEFYIYRAATGELVAETHGVPEHRIYTDGIAKLAIDLSLPGPRGYNLGGAIFQGIEAYQQQNGLTEAFTGRKNKDFLKPGDTVQVVAINRKTGYIGVASAPISQDNAGIQNGLLTVSLNELRLSPPNLRLEVTRVRADDQTFRIGFEGAGLTQDTFIQVSSVWEGPNGEPLPNDLPGYTGRLAKVIGQNQLSEAKDANAVAFFPISPGRHQQILKFKGDVLTTEHFYLHVSPEPEGELADFSVDDSAIGILAYRPKTYVPFKVAIPDVAATREALREDSDTTGVYRWVYRPEMQFSVFDLEQLTLQQGEGNDATEQDLLELEDEPIDLDPEAARILYGILAGTFDPLPLIGPTRELLLGLGNSEYLLCPTQGQDPPPTGSTCSSSPLTFTPEEIATILGYSDGALALALYLNTDPGNRLYDFEHFNLALGIDHDRDGKIGYGTDDRTTSDEPFIFWVNDDFDVVYRAGETLLTTGSTAIWDCAGIMLEDGRQVCEQEDVAKESDGDRNTDPNFSNSFTSRHVESERDLEDLFALELRIPTNFREKLESQEYLLYLSADANVAINLYPRLGTSPRSHVQNPDIAEQQVQEPVWKSLYPGDNQEIEVSPTDWTDNGRLHLEADGRIRLLAEAVTTTAAGNQNDVGALRITIKDKDSEVIAEDELFLEFREIEQLYEHWTVGRGHERESPIAASAALTPESLDYTARNGLELPDHEQEYILLVHGWRMQDFERRRFAETAMKRLYWEGYKGRFGLFSWPTGWFEKPAWEAGTWWEKLDAAGDPQNYDRSEAKARRSGVKLYTLLAELKERQSSLHVVAHSMGNVVVSEALNSAKNLYSGRLLDSYIAMQAAEVAQAYAPEAPEAVVPNLATGGEGPFEDVWRASNFDSIPDSVFDIPPNHYQQTIPNPYTEDMGAWDPDEGMPTHYYAGISNKAGRIANFYNTADFALHGWQFNQATKPDDDFDGIGADTAEWEYEYEEDEDTFAPLPAAESHYFVHPVGGVRHEIFWQQDREVNGRGRPEILAHIIPGRSWPLGSAARLCVPPLATPADALNAIEDFEGCNESHEISDAYGLAIAEGFTDSAYDHSAQFLNSHVARRGFWRALLVASGIKPAEEL